jgi:hypothetical protein
LWVIRYHREWEEQKKYRVLVGKLQGKRPFGRPRLRWEDTKLTLEKQDGRTLTGSSWVRKKLVVVKTATKIRKEISGSDDAGHCWTDSGLDIAGLVQELLPSRKGFCPMELVGVHKYDLS